MMTGTPFKISWTLWQTRRVRSPVAVLMATLLLACSALPVHSQDAAHTPKPILVIDRTAIELSGMTTLSQFLSSRSAFNVFGIQGLSAAIGGSYRVDGRPVTGLDFNIFPLSSIERIELIEEGATRFRGHIGDGTINIVRRRDFQGSEVSAGAGRPEQSGIDSNAGSAIWGGPVGGGHVLVGIDHVFSEEVKDSQRSYTRTRFTDSLAGARSVSIAGNTLLVGDDSHVLGACDPQVYTGPLAGSSGEVCGYPYGNVAWFAGYPRSQRESVFLHADHPIGESAEVYLDMLAAQHAHPLHLGPAAWHLSPRCLASRSRQGCAGGRRPGPCDSCGWQRDGRPPLRGPRHTQLALGLGRSQSRGRNPRDAGLGSGL